MISRLPLANVLLVAAIVSGCVTVTPENAQGIRTQDLCFTLAVALAGNTSADQGALATKELVRRGVLSQREATMAVTGRGVIGMRESAGLCVWGGSYDHVNVTTTAAGVSKQYVFGSYEYSTVRYLYTRNGVVVGTQE